MTNWNKGIPENNKKYLVIVELNKATRYICVAFYAHKNTIKCVGEENEAYEYDDNTETYYLISGWNELIYNWPDYSSLAINEGEVICYAELPEYPDE